MEAEIIAHMHESSDAVVVYSFDQDYQAHLLHGICQFLNLICAGW
jgi:hypothetical protein